MKVLATMIAMLAFLEIATANPDRNLTEMNSEWYFNNYDKVQQILISGTNEEAIPIINTLGLIWKNRDGGIWIEVAPAICNALIYKTRLMLLWFDDYPEEFSSWLKRMPMAMFTVWSDKDSDFAKLEKLRIKMIKHLKAYQKSETNKALKNRCLTLIEVLENTRTSRLE